MRLGIIGNQGKDNLIGEVFKPLMEKSFGHSKTSFPSGISGSHGSRAVDDKDDSASFVFAYITGRSPKS
jgi:hypothetical protein